MALFRPIVRQPWYWAAWVLLATAFGFAVFDVYAVAAILFVAFLVSAAVVLRREREPGGSDGRAAEDPRQ